MRDPMAENPSESAPGQGKLATVAVGRLSLYLRELQRLADAGVKSLNSSDLARLIDVSPEIVRKDLAACDAVGRRGVGYEIAPLVSRISQMLGVQTQWNVVLVGVGSLGTALIRYRGFQRQGFRLVGAFDVDPKLVGTTIGGVKIDATSSLRQKAKALQAQLAVLAVPSDAAAAVADELVAAGINGILNFAPTYLKLPRNVGVVNVDLASEMQRLAFAVSKILPPTPAATPRPNAALRPDATPAATKPAAAKRKTSPSGRPA